MNIFVAIWTILCFALGKGVWMIGVFAIATHPVTKGLVSRFTNKDEVEVEETDRFIW